MLSVNLYLAIPPLIPPNPSSAIASPINIRKTSLFNYESASRRLQDLALRVDTLPLISINAMDFERETRPVTTDFTGMRVRP